MAKNTNSVLFCWFFYLKQHEIGRPFNEFTAGNKQIKKSGGSYIKNLFFQQASLQMCLFEFKSQLILNPV